MNQPYSETKDITNLRTLLEYWEEHEVYALHRNDVRIGAKRLESYHRHGYIAWDTDGFFYVVEAL